MSDRVAKEAHERIYDRRISLRREMDSFTECPKYLKHDISEDQVVLIASRALELQMNIIDKAVSRITKILVLIITVLGLFGVGNHLIN